MTMIPSIYQFALLALISYRLWRLLAEDEIFERPRRYLVRLPLEWEEGDSIPNSYRAGLGEFISCPWCLGAWTSLGSYIGWMFTIGETPDSFGDVLVAAGVWFALSAAVGIIRAKLDPPD